MLASFHLLQPAINVQHRVLPGNPVLRYWRLLAILCALGLGLARVEPVAAQAGLLVPATVNNEDEIVYIDAAGFISVFDPQWPEGLSPIVFRSPDSGWYDATVGDINGDGDDEIIAIAENGLLKIYDPVVNTSNGASDNQSGGIYWEQLFEFVLPGAPLLVDTGNLDGDPATLEMVVVHREPNNAERTRIQVYFQPVPNAGGRIWLPLTDVSARELWSDISVSDLDGDGQAEIALVNEDLGALSIFRREANNVLTEFWAEDSTSRPWQDAVIGNVEPNLPAAELVAVRRVAPPGASLVVRRYQAVNQLADVALRSYLPAPRVTFLADINGDGEDEIFLLRDVPATDTRARLFISNLGTDTFNFEARLDSDNGYRYGASGDTDGDGREEIAVIREDAIRLFTEPEASSTISRTQSVSSNRRTLVMGNLDALGRDLLIASPTTLNFTVPAGEISVSQMITLSNQTRSTAIPFFLRTAPATGLLLVTPSSLATTAQLAVQVDARTLLPASSILATEDAFPILPAADVFTPTYGTNLIIASSNPLVANSPITIPVIVDVTAGIVLRPSQINIMKQQAIDADICSLPATLASVQVLGTPGSTFTATLQARNGAGGDWLGVTPITGTVNTAPLDITVAPNPGLAPGESATATLVLDGVVNTPTPFVVERRLEINIRCYSHLGFLPLVAQ